MLLKTPGKPWSCTISWSTFRAAASGWTFLSNSQKDQSSGESQTRSSDLPRSARMILNIWSYDWRSEQAQRAVVDLRCDQKRYSEEWSIRCPYPARHCQPVKVQNLPPTKADPFRPMTEQGWQLQSWQRNYWSGWSSCQQRESSSQSRWQTLWGRESQWPLGKPVKAMKGCRNPTPIKPVFRGRVEAA